MFELLRLNLGIGVTKEDETSVHVLFFKSQHKAGLCKKISEIC